MQQSPSLTLTKTANGAVTMFRCVTFTGAQATAQGAKVLGISQNCVADGTTFAVVASGTAIIEAGNPIAIGASLICDNQGRAIPSTGTLAVVAGATAMTSTAANGAVLQGGDSPEYVFADALEAAVGAGARIEVLLRR